MYIIGINAYHPGSSATLIKDGKVIAACEEERFTRIKHDSAFPIHSIKYCLKEAKITFKDIHAGAIARNPCANIFRKLIYAITNITKRTKRREIVYASKKVLNTLRFKKLSKMFSIKNPCSKHLFYRTSSPPFIFRIFLLWI